MLYVKILVFEGIIVLLTLVITGSWALWKHKCKKNAEKLFKLAKKEKIVENEKNLREKLDYNTPLYRKKGLEASFQWD